ncbi:DNA-binding transcriptional MerR regulator [Kribbella aluminosa]|uniref:DNA-binding transcriptional MerR regulator n=1 Tax=Kribbella aluminosa TaxID=416017 RepID=A0ABS4UK33_9ACTN|nr:MerR family transcriptional regulator [Kribbella aluminosa]MBP2352012.1 DNA-binding transcriptional MerR regulator [Kribbella aluminosa]
MLTISQLAAYAGVTVRAVRHYHKIGLLPEPGRDRSGYRSYNSAAVVRLIRIHTLADAGVPLARVQELLDAAPEDFEDGVQEIDKELRAEVRRLQDSRRRLARLAAGDHLALPQSVVGYLERLRGLGVSERYVEMERDAWIMVAALVPDAIDVVIAAKHEQLDDPDAQKLYSLVSEAVDNQGDEALLVEIADILERMYVRAFEAGHLSDEPFDDKFVELLDAVMLESAPESVRLLAILEERGWKGWTRIEQVPDGLTRS